MARGKGVVAQTETDHMGMPRLLDRPRVTPQDATTRRYDIAAAALCVAVLILALAVGHLHQVGGFGVETDFYGIYAVQAENLMAGRAYTYLNHPPGYPFLLATASVVARDLFMASKIISAIATAFFGWFTYLTFKGLFNPQIALATTMLLLPATFQYSFLAASDIVGAVMIALALWGLLRTPRLTMGTCLLAGLFAGAAYLVRSNALFVAVGAVFSLLVFDPDQESMRDRLARAGLFAFAALLAASPWLVMNWRTNGSPLASAAYLQVATHVYMPDLNAELSAALRERVESPAAAISRLQVAADFNSFVDVVSHDPPVFLRKYLGSVFSYAGRLAVEGLQFPAYVVGPIGLVLMLGDLSRRRLTYLVGCLFGYLPLALVGFHVRYYLFLLPVGFLLVAYAIFRTMPGEYRLFNLRVPVRWLALLIIAAFLSASAYREVSNAIAAEPRYLFEIAEFLRNRSSPGDIIIGRKPHLAYLAGLKDTFPFVHTAEAYLTKARERRARYVVYSAYEAWQWPGLRSLKDPVALPSGLKLIYHHRPSRTLIYEVDSGPSQDRTRPVGGES